MVNVCFAGLTGWTAQPIVRAIGEADDLVLTAGVSRSAAGRSLGEFGGSSAGSVHATVVEALEATAAGNFSVMAAVLLRAAQVAAHHLDHWEILDYASDGKPDVPSGTSRELADA